LYILYIRVAFFFSKKCSKLVATFVKEATAQNIKATDVQKQKKNSYAYGTYKNVLRGKHSIG
jgi:hypothetical protein